MQKNICFERKMPMHDWTSGKRSRRGVLKLGVTALAGLAAARITRPARAIGRLGAGDGELVTVSDGHLQLPMGFAFPEVPKNELHQLLSANSLPLDTVRSDCNVTILERGDRVIIFDAGSGPNFMPTAGMLVDNLAEAGVDPADVTDVIFTHAHPDHLWGVTDDFDELVFPNADYRMSQAEWDFWSSPETLAAMPEERKSFVVGAQNRFAAIEERISFFKPGDEVAAGVEAVDTPGHTPGHVSFMVHGGGEPVLIAGDAITNAVVSFGKPDWPTGSDQDPALGATTRAMLLDRMASDKARIIGYHFPHPGAGMVERQHGAYRFVTG
jgi:glyoxylase-like metal-dependent hydrolase (beta-lactamase superfamily II)